ncbi:hypothetical protein KIP88_10285 [Bradyrhizobium sp. SRL28]|nr:hypothetical protein [Bradyrhizobium sp. SRL28]
MLRRFAPLRKRFAFVAGNDVLVSGADFAHNTGMPLKLYELVGTDPSRPFSPFCWRERLLDAFDGLARKSPSYYG